LVQKGGDMSIDRLFEREFATFSELIASHAAEVSSRIALADASLRLNYAGLNRLMDRIAAALQRDGLKPGDSVAICATNSVLYGAAFLGILRAGAIVVPLPQSSTPTALKMMLEDAGSKILFLDQTVGQGLAPITEQVDIGRVSLDGSEVGVPFNEWLAPETAIPAPVDVQPEFGFNIIYSSGTTGVPKGIVLSHGMRWAQLRRRSYGENPITLVSTPLYSNTTLVSFLPTLASAGTAVVMGKFDAETFLTLSQQYRVTHAMLVPVQYRRLMEHPSFDHYDLSAYRMKFCTSAPFAASLKAEVLRRWPGGLTEYYGMTEGGGTCMLLAHEHPDKLHTVGPPIPGHDIRLIDDEGAEVPQGEIGEVVGRSTAMMNGYHNQPEKTTEVTWVSPEGVTFIRNGDVGRFDEDGFLILMDRKKDMIISGGFNIYPSDLEREIILHPEVSDVAVVGVPSEQWGETPVAFVVARTGLTSPQDLLAWVNARLGKMQRLSDVCFVDTFPRSHIGKVLKRELREVYSTGTQWACDQQQSISKT
jgi:long-chain acyl-CoA synthetase